jgi:hypothetical protein
VDLTAVLRSLYINIRAGEVLTGASTISMQVIRLAYPERPRTVPVKVLEPFSCYGGTAARKAAAPAVIGTPSSSAGYL